jgi:putative transposase
MCSVLGVHRSGYYAWRKQPKSARKVANEILTEQIRKVHQESRETYGSPRVYRELKARGVTCSENRVARLMREHNIKAKTRRKRRVTTKRDESHPVVTNVLKQKFQAERPDQVWLSDITYIDTGEGWLYLAAVMDLFSRRIVGWAMAERITSELTREALRMSLRQRRPQNGLIHHSDRGAQYTAESFQALLRANTIRPSMSGRGNPYDNAPMESFFGRLKTELVHHCIYQTRQEARISIFGHIEGFYNQRRRHSALDYVSPAAYEQAYLSAQIG